MGSANLINSVDEFSPLNSYLKTKQGHIAKGNMG